jgi:hypothetical protein
MAHSPEPPSEPSYLLADFPPTSKVGLRTDDNKNTYTAESSLENVDTVAPTSDHGMHNEGKSFSRRFLPGRVFADCTATLLPIALLAFAIAVTRLDGKVTNMTEHRKWENAITIVSTTSILARGFSLTNF